VSVIAGQAYLAFLVEEQINLILQSCTRSITRAAFILSVPGRLETFNMPLPFLISLFAILTLAQSISFINPPAAGPNSEYSQDPSFAYGSSMVIEWTPTSNVISMVMYQQTQGAVFEYIFREFLSICTRMILVLTEYAENQQGFSSYNWDINTNKSLDVSRIFFFEIFIKGQTSPAASSHYFNITGSAKSAAITSSSATPPSSKSSAATSKATSSTTRTNTSTKTTSAAPTPSPGGGGLSTGAKVGLGVGIPVAVIAGLLAGWFFFAHKRKSNKHDETQPAETQHGQSQPMMYEYHKPGPIVQPYQGSIAMKQTHELDSRQTHELDTRGVHSPAELPHERWK
jgi:hypothetical protein